MSIRDLILLKNDIEKDFNKEIQGIKYHTGKMESFFHDNFDTKETLIDL
jgi:hypothetical protein